MALLLLVIAGFIGVGFTRAYAYARARAPRRVFQTLIADPAPAAASALSLMLAYGKLPAWKRALFVVLEFLVDVTTWPVREVLEYRDRRRRPDRREPLFRDTRWDGSEEELTPEYVSRRVRRRSLVTCTASVFLIFTAAFVTRAADGFQIKVLTWVFLLGVVARQVQDLLDDKSVSKLARRSGLPGPLAYRDVLLIAAADLLTLYICSVLLLHWDPSEPLRNVWFPKQLTAVVNGKVGGLWPAVTESPSAVLVGIASITFGASLYKPLKMAVGRRRSGDDLMAAAKGALLHGRSDSARHRLELGRLRKPSVGAVSEVEGLLALSDGKMLDAWMAAQTVVRQSRPSQNLDELRQREDGLWVVQDWCRELGVTPRPSIVEMARDAPVRDSMMAWLVGKNPNALLPDSSRGARVAALENALDPPAWPLTFSVAYELDGDLAAAAHLLPAADQVTGLDLLWRNQLARGLRDNRDGNRLGVDGWPERITENARALLADVGASDNTTWPEWHRSAFSRALSVPLLLGEQIGLDDQLAEALMKARYEIAGERGDDVEFFVLRNMILSQAGD
jgi:hypothetical protein